MLSSEHESYAGKQLSQFRRVVSRLASSISRCSSRLAPGHQVLTEWRRIINKKATVHDLGVSATRSYITSAARAPFER